jgi:Uncharacterised protein family (UPF0236)
MTRKKTLKDFGFEDLQHELDVRWAEQHDRPGMTMSQMELLIWEHVGMESPAALRHLKVLLARLPMEKPTGKPCPKCGKRAGVKAKDRDRTLRTMAGTVTLMRNYHYCEECGVGFYPLDRALDLPEEGELTHEMQKRVTDFAVNDVYEQGAARWNLHYREPISDNLLRRVAARVGALCETVDQGHLQEALKPAPKAAAEVLVVQPDGSMLPIVGAEAWKEAKVAVTYRHDVTKRRPVRGSARYAAVVGTVANFAPVLEELLAAERVDEVRTVIWLADGAPCNWTLADQIAPDAVQVLDWFHAVQHAMDCGKVLLGEEDESLPLWHRRAEQLLAAGDAEAFISELMDCLPLLEKRRGTARREALEALDDLVRYYRANAHRMRYALFLEHGFPIGSGAVESAHKHVLQCRMKRAGQRWSHPNARRMAALRAAYRTGGAASFYDAIQRAHRASQARVSSRPGRRHGFHFARQGSRDRDRAAAAASM